MCAPAVASCTALRRSAGGAQPPFRITARRARPVAQARPSADLLPLPRRPQRRRGSRMHARHAEHASFVPAHRYILAHSKYIHSEEACLTRGERELPSAGALSMCPPGSLGAPKTEAERLRWVARTDRGKKRPHTQFLQPAVIIWR
ncbi:hypothetical protein MTO96_020979 [Rhipicephalus appendiculatus]